MAKKLLILSDCGERVPAFDPAFDVTALPLDADSQQRLSAIEGAEIIIGEPTIEELKRAGRIMIVHQSHPARFKLFLKLF